MRRKKRGLRTSRASSDCSRRVDCQQAAALALPQPPPVTYRRLRSAILTTSYSSSRARTQQTPGWGFNSTSSRMASLRAARRAPTLSRQRPWRGPSWHMPSNIRSCRSSRGVFSRSASGDPRSARAPSSTVASRAGGIFPGASERAVLHQKPGERSGRRTRRHLHLGGLRSDGSRPKAPDAVRTARRRWRGAPFERAH